MTKASPIISLTNIVKKYHIGSVETIILKKVSVDVNKGEMIAIVGASGSGKSTLMNIIGLLDKADNGKYLLKGNDVAGLSEDELAKLRNQSIVFVFQQFNLLPRFNAIKNIALPLIYRAIPQELINKKVDDVLKRVGMEDFASHRPTQLSGGQQQRIAIARALVGDPEVILADEPTGSLDSRTGKEIMNLFSALNNEGRTIILVTHDEQVASLCERRITLVDGKIVSSQ